MRILLVDDHAIVREGLKRVLNAIGASLEIGEAAGRFPHARNHADRNLRVLAPITLQGAGFAINNPNAQRSCGCGQSFS